MESSNEGRRKSVRLANKQEPIASTSTAKMKEDNGKKKVLEKKVVASSSSDDVLMAEFDSTFLDSCAAGEKAMGISLILQCVISKMNVPNLKSARAVSKTWKEEADKEIRLRGCFRLSFDPESRPFDEGLKQLKFSKDLPCFDFHLTILDMEMKQVKKFLSFFGSQVTSLTLNSWMNGKALSALLVGVPNLEHLFLSNEFFTYWRSEEVPKLKIEGDLINLKHITYYSQVEYYSESPVFEIQADSKAAQIIEKAPNLLSINDAIFSYDLLKANGNAEDASKWKGKIHLIKSFQWPEVEAYDDDDRERDFGFETYANAGLQVENLSITWVDSVENQVALRKLVKSSQDTLKTLVAVSTFICLPQETGFGPAFLPFQNLKTLEIWIEEFMWKDLCRNDFESKHLSQFGQEAFPNLTTVILNLPTNRSFRESTIELEYSPFEKAIESVVNLEIRGEERSMDYWKIDEHRMRRIKELFPNVKHLKLKDSSQLPQILPFCFSLWPQLESLQFHVNFMRQRDMRKSVLEKDYFEAMNRYGNLDVIFTGLSLDICKRLRKAKPGKMLKKDVQVAQDINSEQRSRNSLVSLKELKKLTVVFSDIRPEISRTECPISSVSCFYAFKLMPNLKVRVLYDQNLAIFNPETRGFEDQYNMEKYLAELAPHCEIGHWETGGVASLIPKERTFVKPSPMALGRITVDPRPELPRRR